MAHAEYNGIGIKGQSKFRLYYDGPKHEDGRRNQIKEPFAIFPLPEKAASIIKAAKNRKKGDITKTEVLLLDGFEKKAKELADFEARKKEQEVNDPKYIKPIVPVVDKGELLTELSARWFKHKAGTSRKGRKAPKTMLRYKQLLERIDEFFINDYVEDINIDRVEEFYAWLAEQVKKPGNRHKPTKESEKLSKQTQWHYHRCLYSNLEYAVAREKLQSNPCKYVSPQVPDERDKKPDAYNEEQAAEIKSLMEFESLKHRVFVNISLEVGTRPEESTALKWTDIDFENRMVDFNKVWQYVSGLGNLEIPHLKTDHSRRKNRLSSHTIFLLKQLKGHQDAEAERLGTKWMNSGAVFVNWNGQQSSPTWASQWWSDWIKIQSEKKSIKPNLPDKVLYSLRHTCISILVNAGESPLEIANMVGHVNANMIWKVYGHPSQKEKYNGADVIQSIMDKKVSMKKVEQKVEQFI